MASLFNGKDGLTPWLEKSVQEVLLGGGKQEGQPEEQGGGGQAGGGQPKRSRRTVRRRPKIVQVMSINRNPSNNSISRLLISDGKTNMCAHLASSAAIHNGDNNNNNDNNGHNTNQHHDLPIMVGCFARIEGWTVSSVECVNQNDLSATTTTNHLTICIFVTGAVVCLGCVGNMSIVGFSDLVNIHSQIDIRQVLESFSSIRTVQQILQASLRDYLIDEAEEIVTCGDSTSYLNDTNSSTDTNNIATSQLLYLYHRLKFVPLPLPAQTNKKKTRRRRRKKKNINNNNNKTSGISNSEEDGERIIRWPCICFENKESMLMAKSILSVLSSTPEPTLAEWLTQDLGMDSSPRSSNNVSPVAFLFGGKASIPGERSAIYLRSHPEVEGEGSPVPFVAHLTEYLTSYGRGEGVNKDFVDAVFRAFPILGEGIASSTSTPEHAAETVAISNETVEDEGQRRHRQDDATKANEQNDSATVPTNASHPNADANNSSHPPPAQTRQSTNVEPQSQQRGSSSCDLPVAAGKDIDDLFASIPPGVPVESFLLPSEGGGTSTVTATDNTGSASAAATSTAEQQPPPPPSQQQRQQPPPTGQPMFAPLGYTVNGRPDPLTACHTVEDHAALFDGVLAEAARQDQAARNNSSSHATLPPPIATPTKPTQTTTAIQRPYGSNSRGKQMSQLNGYIDRSRMKPPPPAVTKPGPPKPSELMTQGSDSDDNDDDGIGNMLISQEENDDEALKPGSEKAKEQEENAVHVQSREDTGGVNDGSSVSPLETQQNEPLYTTRKRSLLPNEIEERMMKRVTTFEHWTRIVGTRRRAKNRQHNTPAVVSDHSHHSRLPGDSIRLWLLKHTGPD